MRCYHCENELIWGGDHDLDEDDRKEYDIVTNLSCPSCATVIYMYHKIKE